MTFHRLPFPIVLVDYRRRRQATFELQDDPDLASAQDSLARIVRSTWSWTRSIRRTRSKASDQPAESPLDGRTTPVEALPAQPS